jgi:hypothetical protein
MQPPLVLGIHSGHNAGAALISGGRILSAVSEERLSRQKNITCYPARAIELCLRMASVQASDLDAVALASRHTFGGTGAGLSETGARRLAPLVPVRGTYSQNGVAPGHRPFGAFPPSHVAVRLGRQRLGQVLDAHRLVVLMFSNCNSFNS